MEPHDRATALFERCKQAGLVGINGDGAPTRDMVAEAILDAGDYSAEASELATYCRRLVRLVREHLGQSEIAAHCGGLSTMEMDHTDMRTLLDAAEQTVWLKRRVGELREALAEVSVCLNCMTPTGAANKSHHRRASEVVSAAFSPNKTDVP